MLALATREISWVSATLDKAVTVKLTRTLAIIPITLVLALLRSRRAEEGGAKVQLRKVFPFFILYFILASVVTTAAVGLGAPVSVFSPVKTLSKFFIVMAMGAIGLNTDLVKLVRTGGKPLLMGLCCWAGITGVSLALLDVQILWAVSFIGLTTFCLSAAGVWAGHRFGARYKGGAELAGGVVLILIGVKVLLEHLGLLSL